MRAQIGDVLITDLDASRIDHYTHKIERRYGGPVADQQKALISNLWEEAKDHAEIDRKGKINPTLDTKVRYKVKRSTKAWSAEAHEAFLATARSTLTLAADLLYFTGQRGGDATKARAGLISVCKTPNSASAISCASCSRRPERHSGISCLSRWSIGCSPNRA